MKIFISSLIGGFEPFRAAARSAVTALKHEAVMAEDFPAQPNSPQIACLQGVRSADLVVLILGERYGSVQGTSNVSPTHEEFLEARDSRPVFVFVQEGITRDAQQTKFVTEVQGWQHGYFRGGFTTPEQLRDLVTGAIHEYQLAHATAPLDTGALKQSSIALLPREGRGNTIQSPVLYLAIAGGPLQNILRPAELEAPALASDLHQRALFTEPLLFDRSKGVESDIDGAALVLEQDGGSRIQLDEQGGILLRLPLEDRRPRGQHGFGGSFAIIEETVVRQLSAGIAYAAWLFERIDATQKLTHVALSARINASEHLGWRTQAEDDAQPNSGSMGFGGNEEKPPVTVSCPRAALRFDAMRLSEDLMVPLRRQRKSR
ncbi:DUF4062 domain-containing protein [Variovorax sp. H27-G14]|uniref:DUF4062 domain-containing protein n=1 Tax=Variovorax sp. H27-G14 TaxID=3111914 RepID=UPI0038FC92D9